MRWQPFAEISVLVIATLTAVATAAACIPATNPCDPAAPIDVQSQGTRISGRVVDQDGSPRAGILVSVVGRAETIATAADGSFILESLPPSSSYELQALPAAPLVGARTSTPPLSCRGALEDIELVVIEPPTSPEVEIARASGEQRLFVAFGAAGDAQDFGDQSTFFESGDFYRDPVEVVAQCDQAAATSKIAYRAQVRAPFGAWRDAVLAPFPWVLPTANDPERLYTERIDDECAAAACAQFAYLDSTLANPNARCIDVVGVRDGESEDNERVPFKLLEPFGSYQVRIVAELRTDDALRDRFVLPERVEAEASASGLHMTLVPTALLPVMGADGLPRPVGDIAGLVATAGGRFALLEDDALSVIGQGRDTLDEAAQETVNDGVAGVDGVAAPQDAYGEDNVAAENMVGDFAEGASVPVQPLAILTAGDWVRVIRRGEDGSASIEKVYVGDSAEANALGPSESERDANAEQPELRIDPAGGSLRAFEYMVPDDDVVQVGSDPKDAYVLLYGSAFVLAEQAPVNEMELAYFTRTDDPTTGEIVETGWSAPAPPEDAEALPADASAMAGKGCALLEGAAAASTVSEDGLTANVNVCYDLGAGLGEEALDLRDVAVLDDRQGVRRSHVLTDASGDRVFVASKDALVCAACDAGNATSLSTEIVEVPVGREPLGLLRTRLLDCAPGAENVGRPVVLVANHGSGDLSVLEDDAAAGVRETFVVPLSALPVAFLDDPEGPTCDDPFVWVMADDGRVIPVDMRGEPSAPLCGNGTCEVGTRGRGAVGAIARRVGDGAVTAKSRALVGGASVLGELGFFRPKALKGAAFVGADEIASGAKKPGPPASDKSGGSGGSDGG